MEDSVTNEIIFFSAGMMNSYVSIFVLTILFGVLAGAFHSQRATIVSEFVAKEQMASTVGFVIFFQGLGNILGPPVAGEYLLLPSASHVPNGLDLGTFCRIM